MSRSLAKLAAVGSVAAAAGLAWSVAETRRYRMRMESLPILPAGADPLRVLHLSDLHITPSQGDKKQWVAALAAWDPHLTVVTGDFLAHHAAVPVALEALRPLLTAPGVFVLGSNDYYAPKPFNPARYLRGPSELESGRAILPWPDLVSGLTRAGWTDLNNSRAQLNIAGLRLDTRGVDDPHIELDDYNRVAGPFERSADLRLGVAHAPYLRVLDAMSADGADLMLAGHTHGGQLRVPGYGALVTNCDLPRNLARGLHQYPADSETWLQVSAGMGQSPYAPIRFACPPEAVLLTLTGSDVNGSEPLG
jgi:predicted MPP superfamily phosphohydrolase